MHGAPAPDASNLRVWEVAGASHLSLDEMHSYMDEQHLRSGLMRHADGTPSNLSDIFVGCANYPSQRASHGDAGFSIGIASLGLRPLEVAVHRGLRKARVRREETHRATF
jgi:hypothetical protein